MKIQSKASGNKIHQKFAHWKFLTLITIGIICSSEMVPCIADEPTSHEKSMDMSMDMKMDSSSHEHAMEPSEHQHHMMMSKPGLLLK